jgi:hypothetical protein
VRVTVSSDDPPFFATTLPEELRRVSAVAGLSRQDIVELPGSAPRMPRERRRGMKAVRASARLPSASSATPRLRSVFASKGA